MNGRVPNQSARQGINTRLINDKLSKIPDISPIETRNWLLHRYFIRHEYKVTKVLIDKELSKLNGHNEYANYLKGIILRREGKIQESLDSFQNSYNINATNINNVKQIAKSLFLLGNHKRAIDAYSEAERMSSMSPDWEIHHSLGECYIALNLIDDTIRELKRAITLTKNEAPFITLARFYQSQNRISESIDIYNMALKNCSENENISIELGLIYLKMDNIQKAFQQFGSVLAQFPGCVRAILPLSFIIQSNQDYDVALSKYKIATQVFPESPYLWNNIGMCFFSKQKYIAAISCLKRAHYLNPIALEPAYNLGKVLLTTGQPASAAVYLCSAVTATPKNPLPYLLLGIALKKLNDLEGAEKVLTKSHSLNPQDPLILLNYAIILEAVENYEKVSEILSNFNDVSTVINIDPKLVEVSRKLFKKIGGTLSENNDAELIREDDEV